MVNDVVRGIDCKTAAIKFPNHVTLNFDLLTPKGKHFMQMKERTT